MSPSEAQYCHFPMHSDPTGKKIGMDMGCMSVYNKAMNMLHNWYGEDQYQESDDISIKWAHYYIQYQYIWIDQVLAIAL